ncbi:2OG-Fe(II) oxygenase [Brevundimonas goettingensis]|uniref:2OG-Fe(II) oxygenase n=1 Tax=Brevundimonas goettingensis TaxID=2774190 RepID=A0A975C2W7_9CAUL|nr:2OG-Fe(II) oxygenase [Brevundimonas goettingensis]QTC91474.1 2OG-Fe(II) oxygenase [Brevundimonas goettingensis]
MIRFERLAAEADALSEQFQTAKPFRYVVIDDFCDASKLEALLAQIPSPEDGSINKSRDYVFARNKFEKSNFREIGPLFDEIYLDLMSDRFKELLQKIVSRPTWIDPEFHGGGIHQGGEGSFLDMHVDFSHHPENPTWERELNILLYLNRDWLPEHGGCLNLRHIHTGEATQVEPLFNRCVIMETKAHTLHGYDRLNFPKGMFRRSIATYAYVPAETGAKGRSTTWFPEDASPLKRLLGKSWPQLVAIKTKILGSATSKNK